MSAIQLQHGMGQNPSLHSGKKFRTIQILE
jgi:hypothetical protein